MNQDSSPESYFTAGEDAAPVAGGASVLDWAGAAPGFFSWGGVAGTGSKSSSRFWGRLVKFQSKIWTARRFMSALTAAPGSELVMNA